MSLLLLFNGSVQGTLRWLGSPASRTFFVDAEDRVFFVS